MVWLEFVLASVLVVIAAIKLAEYGDIISVHTGLGGMFIGTLLMAGATSLPEFLTIISSINQLVPDLAAGNLFGSNMFNMLLLAVLDLSNQQARILRFVAMRHALTGSLAILLIAVAMFFILAGVDFQLGWVGAGSLLLMVGYLVGVWLIRRSGAAPADSAAEAPTDLPTIGRSAIGFAAATIVLVIVTPSLVSSSVGISELTGIGTGFIGVALLGMITSLPELVAVVAASRLGAYDLAVGNLFGSNLFNMFALGLADVFYLRGNFLIEIDPTFALAALLGLLLTNLALVGNLARVERRLLFVEADALLILIGYVAGLWLLFTRGLGT